MIFFFLELLFGVFRVDKMLIMYVEIMFRFIKVINVKGNVMWEEYLVDLVSYIVGFRIYGLLFLVFFKKIYKIF